MSCNTMGARPHSRLSGAFLDGRFGPAAGPDRLAHGVQDQGAADGVVDAGPVGLAFGNGLQEAVRLNDFEVVVAHGAGRAGLEGAVVTVLGPDEDGAHRLV